ncbi:MAG: chromosomal replication initiator protein DnaA, partial [Alphaproteobacteria bacterium]|nr:chromosomal replication initiator protein DnaA [Alphaproteobacteria bacterium]
MVKVEPQSSPERWEQFQIALRSRVTPVTWQTWLEPLQPDDISEDRVRLLAPSEFHLRWVMDKYLGSIEEAVGSAFGEMAVVELEASPEPVLADLEDADDEADPDDIGVGKEPAQAHHHPQGSERSALVPKYQFENFVVGPSNRFAHAAAMAVSEQPGRHYNPLFIYGEAGLGKTHLLHAVGQQSGDLYPTMAARYVTSENFFNHFIEGIRRKRMDQFKDRYRNVDILLLDDVQFFEGKEQILEEFFHTFNALYESGKQLVISSDRHPKHLSTLEDRLRSRFEWGLLTDIQPPDVETRLAILRKNAEFAPRPVPETVLEFIASQVSTNIRELEGALTRVTAYAALTSQGINLEMAQDVLQDLVTQGGAGRDVTPQDIINATSASFGVS